VTADGRERGLGYLKNRLQDSRWFPSGHYIFAMSAADLFPKAKGIRSETDDISGNNAVIDILWALQ
jgi:hypothetical protein